VGGLGDVAPPRAITVTRMFLTKRRIIQYAQQHNHLPANLSELPPMPNYDTSINDAWGHPLDYSFDASGVVTLRSPGTANWLGGDGDNRAITGKFVTRDPQGHWQNELAEWTVDPRKP
jgi:hypothetical protein